MRKEDQLKLSAMAFPNLHVLTKINPSSGISVVFCQALGFG